VVKFDDAVVGLHADDGAVAATAAVTAAPPPDEGSGGKEVAKGGNGGNEVRRGNKTTVDSEATTDADETDEEFGLVPAEKYAVMETAGMAKQEVAQPGGRNEDEVTASDRPSASALPPLEADGSEDENNLSKTTDDSGRDKVKDVVDDKVVGEQKSDDSTGVKATQKGSGDTGAATPAETEDENSDDEVAVVLPFPSFKPPKTANTVKKEGDSSKVEGDDTNAVNVSRPDDIKPIDSPRQLRGQGKGDSDVEIVEIDDDSPNDDDVVVVDNDRVASSGSSTRPCRVYFLKFGRAMSQQRATMLASNLWSKDKRTTFADSFRPSQITHIVVDEAITAAQAAGVLGFQDEKSMAKVITRRNIHMVTPSWILHAENTHDEPALDQMWAGLRAIEGVEKKKRPFQETLSYLPTQDTESSGESVAEKSDEDFCAITKVKASSLGEEHMAARMIKKKQKVSVEAKQRNLGLFNIFLEISNLHKDSPIFELDDFKSKLYAKLAWRVRYLDFDVAYTTLNRLKEVDGFGESVMGKVREFLITGTCQKIEEFNKDPLRITIKKLCDIWGVGAKKAHELAREGYRNISDVRKGLESGKLQLSKNALLGVKYYEELLEKMERSEVDRITDVISEICSDIPRLRDVEIINQGSYRRGDDTCGDADLLMVHPKYVDHLPKGGLGEIVNKLEEKGYIAHHLNHVEGMVSATKKQDTGKKKRDESGFDQEAFQGSLKEEDSAYSYMCIFNSPVHEGKHRRVDLKFYPYQDRAYASLYFTGNTAFNRSMRSYAMQRKNYGLSDHGLYPLQDADRVKSHQQRRQYRSGRIHASTEEEIFEKLGLVWRGPTERKCFDHVIEKES